MAKHILMLGHCLGRLSNFNCYVYQPKHGIECLLSFWCVKKHLPVIMTRISLPSFIQSHALAPASQAVGRRYRSWASNDPTLVQCLVFYVLSYHWTGGGTQMAVYTCIRLIKCPHILRIVPLSKIIYMRLSTNVRSASQTVSQH